MNWKFESEKSDIGELNYVAILPLITSEGWWEYLVSYKIGG
jgi:hypothetical protein